MLLWMDNSELKEGQVSAVQVSAVVHREVDNVNLNEEVWVKYCNTRKFPMRDSYVDCGFLKRVPRAQPFSGD